MTKRKDLITWVLACAVLLMFGTNSVLAQNKVKFEDKFERTIDLVRDGKVIINNVSGNIEVRTWDRAQVQIDALKVSRSTTQARAKENADKVEITIAEEDSTVRIKTEYPESKNRNINVSVYYTLTIPADASLNATTVSGNVTCEDISGDLKANTASGNVTATGVKNGANLSTTSGNVEVDDIVGDVKLHTVSGSVIANNVKGSVAADTTSGSIVLTNITDADEIDANVMSGKVKYEGDLDSNGYYHLQTHSGRVEFIVPSGAAFDLDARTFSGSINSDFDITVRGKIDKKSLRGSVNGGGAEVELKAFSGNIYIKKK